MPPERPFCSHPALLSLAIRQDRCEKSPCLRAKNLAIQRTLLIKTTSDNKKGSFAQQLRKAAQTVGIDSPAHPHCGAPQGSVSGNAVSML